MTALSVTTVRGEGNGGGPLRPLDVAGLDRQFVVDRSVVIGIDAVAHVA